MYANYLSENKLYPPFASGGLWRTWCLLPFACIRHHPPEAFGGANHRASKDLTNIRHLAAKREDGIAVYGGLREKILTKNILHLTSNRYAAIFQIRLLKLRRFLMIIEIIRENILAYGKSRYQLSKETGVGEDQLCRIMQGKTCTLETADKLCKYFKLKLEGDDNRMRTHKRRDGVPTATFEELNFKEQAQSITAWINTLERMINSHIRRAREESRDIDNIRERRLEQVQRMITRIRG
jgi:hypothetical protein